MSRKYGWVWLWAWTCRTQVQTKGLLAFWVKGLGESYRTGVEEHCYPPASHMAATPSLQNHSDSNLSFAWLDANGIDWAIKPWVEQRKQGSCNFNVATCAYSLLPGPQLKVYRSERLVIRSFPRHFAQRFLLLCCDCSLHHPSIARSHWKSRPMVADLRDQNLQLATCYLVESHQVGTRLFSGEQPSRGLARKLAQQP